MRSVIRWAIGNSPAMNTILIATMLIGGFSLIGMRREVFPEFTLDIVLVSVPYPGASPQEVEEGICQKIEEACQTLTGIRKQTAIAQEGAGFLVLELEAGTDVQKLLNEVRSEIDQIPSFPELAEDPEVQEITFRMPAIKIGVIGPNDNSLDSRIKLRELTEQVRKELLQEPMAPPRGIFRKMLSAVGGSSEKSGVTSAEVLAAANYQIDVEISEDTLRQYGLSLRQVAQIIRKENLELPGGNLKTAGQELLLRGKAKRVTGSEIESIQIIAQPNGDILTLADLGNVVDGFDDITAINEIDVVEAENKFEGKPALVIGAERTSNEDLFSVVDTVHQYVERKKLEIPPGYDLITWDDQSIDVQDRMSMLLRNGVGGLVLVFLVLAVFLELRLAFWVAMGIPISVLGSGIVLIYMGQTLNMLSMFAFLMALGIVVDDAIVIGENIFEHRQSGKSFIRAAIDGTIEVLPSVAASVSTTIIAFSPLLFVAGIMGKFIAVMPIAVIAMLVISLIESTFILPCHLAHEKNLFLTIVGWVLFPFRFLADVFHWLNRRADQVLNFLIQRTYLPTLDFCLRYKATVFAGCFAVMLLTAGLVRSGMTPFVLFPKLDSRNIEASVVFPDGTPMQFAEDATALLQQAIQEVNDELYGGSVVTSIYRNVGTLNSQDQLGPTGVSSGGHVGSVQVALVPVEDRDVVSQEVLREWRKRVAQLVDPSQFKSDGELTDDEEAVDVKIPGADIVRFTEASMGPGGTPIEFQLLADKEHFTQLEEAVEACKDKLAEYDGVLDIEDDSRPGKWELQIRLKDSAKALGITLDDVARTVRAAFYGEEVMRVQRGRHEVKLMVRYPEGERRSLENFENIRIRGDDGVERPVTELADIKFARGYSEINRVNQLRSITVSADVDENKANARVITAELKGDFMGELKKQYPNVYVRWEGQQQQTAESVSSLFRGLVIALLAMFVLLTLEFRSYLQPAIIMAIIPFGAVGAILGHLVMDLEVTLFSLFGLVALTGVVVNDSIVLVDFINHRRQEMPLRDALLEAGRRRFRPVLLTSLTTIAGLVPMLLETSFQAQILIPMATSLCFGLLFATLLVLVLVPVFFDVYAKLVRMPAEDDEESEVASGNGQSQPAPAAIEEPRRRPREQEPVPVET